MRTKHTNQFSLSLSQNSMMDEDDTPLLVTSSDEGELTRSSNSPKKADSAKDEVNLKNMVLFHGKVRSQRSLCDFLHNQMSYNTLASPMEPLELW